MKSVWKCKIINVPHHYRVCPFCDWSFDEERGQWIPLYCGGCGKRLFTEEELEEGEAREE